MPSTAQALAEIGITGPDCNAAIARSAFNDTAPPMPTLPRLTTSWPRGWPWVDGHECVLLSLDAECVDASMCVPALVASSAPDGSECGAAR